MSETGAMCGRVHADGRQCIQPAGHDGKHGHYLGYALDSWHEWSDAEAAPAPAVPPLTAEERASWIATVRRDKEHGRRISADTVLQVLEWFEAALTAAERRAEEAEYRRTIALRLCDERER